MGKCPGQAKVDSYLPNGQGGIQIFFEPWLLVDLNYNFECDWFVELSDNKLSNNKLSDNKLSDNNLASELVGNRSFLNQSQLRKL